MANIELDGANKKIKVDSGDLTLDVPGDIVLDADGGDVVFADGGTNLLKVTNSSSDVVLQPQVDAKDIIFKQYDGTVVATVEDNATFNIPASKLAIGGTAVTSTAAELNILDGVTSTAAELNILDGVTSTTAELNILDGVTATAAEINLIDGGTARGTTAIADGDGVLINDAGTMRQTTVETLKTYIGGAGLTFISKHTASDGDSYLTLDGVFSSTYDNYLLIGTIFLPNTDNNHIRMQLKTDAFSADSIYDSQMLKHSQGSVGNVINQTNEAYGVIGGVGNQGAGSREHSQFQLTMYQPNHGPQHAYWTTLSSGKDYSNHYIAGFGGGVWADDTAVTGIRFYYGSGTIFSGEVAVYGIKPS